MLRAGFESPFYPIRDGITIREKASDQFELSSSSCASGPQPAAAGSFDADSVAAAQARAALAGHEFGGTVGAKYHGAARRAWFTAGEAVGSRLAPVGEDGDGGVGEHFDFADDAVAAAMLAFTTAGKEVVGCQLPVVGESRSLVGLKPSS